MTLFALLTLLAASVVLLPDGIAASASQYPGRPIRFIVPFAAGGANDLLARLIGEKLTESLGPPVVVDARPGAGGTIAASLVAQSAPDGYTIFLGSATQLAVAPHLYRKLPYDPLKDLAPITLITITPDVVVVNPSLPVKSVRELIAYARARPGQLTFGSSGIGGSAHLAGELLGSMAGIRMTHVPYKGTALAIMAVVSGELSLGFPSILNAIPVIRSAKVRALAVTSVKPSAALPELPTVAETVPGYFAGPWYGVLAPAGTPGRIISRLNGEIVRILNAPEVRDRLTRDGAEPVAGTPEEFAAFIRAETARVGEVIRQAGIRVE